MPASSSWKAQRPLDSRSNDGYPDVIFTGASSLVAHTVLYRNEPAPGGGRQFTPVANSRLPDLKDSSVAWGDFNNDGLPDLLLAGTTRLTSPERLAGIYLNNGAEEFNILAAGLPAVGDARVAVADFNRDGRLDVLVAGKTQTNRQTRLLLGNLTVTNTAPAAPAGLSATLTAKGLALAWATGTDGETPAPGLNYNVRITGPASRPVVLPAALADGTRLLPAAGNAGTTNVWQLRQYNLPTGLYTWNVQAIDSAFTGSAFSTNGSFYVEQPVVYSNGLGVDGHYQLQFTGTNQTYQVEMAPDLLDCGFSVWTRLGPATSNAPGQFEFRDPEGATQPSRFYRLVWP